jgi:predicted outer membrane repeat protein
VITHNSDASSGNEGGGAIYADGSATIINNTISNNSVTGYTSRAGGIFFDWGDTSKLINNTITNNSALGMNGCGGAIFCYQYCSPAFTNNTIANNQAGQDGGALYCYNNANPTFRNCILYGNKTSQDSNQVYLYDEASDPDFYYCDVQRGVAGFNLNGNFYTGNYQNNINSNPLFNWPSQGSGTGYNGVIADWSESGLSPCINAGDPAGTYPDKDKAGNPRVVENRIDMGAYEDQFLVGFPGTDFHQQTVVCPNPFNSSTVIYFRTTTADGTLRIFDAYGKTLKIIPGISGDHVRIGRGNLPAGVIYYEIMTGNKPFARGKLMIIDQ